MTCLRHTRAQAGFSLIEIMVAVLALSLAFLSLGALAARSLSSNNSAMSHSMATIAMYAITDAMRADRANAVGGDYNNGGHPIAASQCAGLTPPQLRQWCTHQLADPALGGPVDSTTATIDCQATGVCTVTLTWDDSRAGKAPGGNASPQTMTTTGIL